MGYKLTSHTQLEAAWNQYPINTEAQVKLTLLGKHSYCYLNPIQDGRIKEILAKVGRDFERNHQNTFFNFNHTFSYVHDSEENNELVKDIFEYVKQAFESQTNGQCDFALAHMQHLKVAVAEDRSFSPSARAYELTLNVYENIIESAEKAGVTVKKFGDIPQNTYCRLIRTGEF